MPRPAKLQSDYEKKDQVNCNQVPMNDDKNCQDNKCVNIWPVKPEMDMQSKEPQSSFKKKQVPLCNVMYGSARCKSKRLSRGKVSQV